MDEVYKPISRQDILATLVTKYGGVEVARYFVSDAISDLQTMEVGVAENNPLMTAKCIESLKETLTSLRSLLEKKEYNGGVEKGIKDNLK